MFAFTTLHNFTFYRLLGVIESVIRCLRYIPNVLTLLLSFKSLSAGFNQRLGLVNMKRNFSKTKCDTNPITHYFSINRFVIFKSILHTQPTFIKRRLKARNLRSIKYLLRRRRVRAFWRLRYKTRKHKRKLRYREFRQRLKRFRFRRNRRKSYLRTGRVKFKYARKVSRPIPGGKGFIKPRSREKRTGKPNVRVRVKVPVSKTYYKINHKLTLQRPPRRLFKFKSVNLFFVRHQAQQINI